MEGQSSTGLDSSETISTRRHTEVRFASNPTISVFESEDTDPSEFRPKMVKREYESFSSSDVTDNMLVEAAKLFSENYGIWGEKSHSPGTPVKLNARRLREQYLPAGANAFYTRVVVDGTLAGNVFACRWKCDDSHVCWITQLVVHKAYRERGLASGLLRSLMAEADDIYGIMSSHPAACLAAATCFAKTIEKISLDFISKRANDIMKSSPIPYIKDAKLCGTLFNPNDATGLVCGVDTDFFVDHEEPLEALQQVKQDWEWPLGDLPDGKEYLLLLPCKKGRSRSRSSSK